MRSAWLALPVLFAATAAAAPPGRVRVESTPSGAAIYVGLSPAGETPMELPLAAGRYTLTVAAAGRAPRRRTLEVAAGQRLRVALDLAPARTERPPEADPPPGPCRISGSSFCGYGRAVGLVDPLAAELTAIGRALGALASFAVQSGRVAGNSAAFEVPLRGARVLELGEPRPGEARARVGLGLERERGAPRVISSRGAGQLLAYGPGSEALQASAELSALGRALLELALERGDVRVARLESRDPHPRYATLQLLFEGELSAGGAQLRVKLNHRDQERLDPSAAPADPPPESRAIIEASTSSITARLALEGGVIDPRDPVDGSALDPQASLQRLRSVLRALGARVSARRLAPILGTPIHQVELTPPPGER